MRSFCCCAIALFVFSLSLPTSHAQGETGVPFLLIEPSPEANGRGNTGTAVISNNPIATLTNAGQLGIFSLSNYFSGSLYTPKTQWLPTFGLSDLTYSVWAANAGYNLREALGLPFEAGIGIGYSRIDLNLGTFMRMNENGEVIGTFDAYEKSEQMSMGFGADYFLRIGVGWNFKNIRSVLGGSDVAPFTSEAKASATDFGLIIQAPIFDILKMAGTESVDIYPGIEPLVNITFGYARSNMSNQVIHYGADLQFTDPLPRNATIGLSADFGLVANVNAQSWKIIMFTVAREAQDVLVTRYADGRFSYQPGLGDISFFGHVVRGELSRTDKASLHKGWEVGLGEFVYIRGGSFAQSPDFGNRNFTTSGLGIRLAGLFKAIGTAIPESAPPDVFSFLIRHVDVAFDHAEYKTSDGHPLSGTKFSSISVMIR
ncbi:MAG: hypothetical protein HY961_16765 [Ignavibacteriae bacterium]|nr:hypothetical protein [Ignavibacteriota bacterium]